MIFTNPIHEVVAWTVDEVRQSLKKILKYTKQGYYAAGYIAYEAAPAFNKTYSVCDAGDMPLLWFGIFPEIKTQDLKITKGSYELGSWISTIKQQEYNEKIRTIKSAIKLKQTKQVNYTMRLKAKFKGNDRLLFDHLSNAQNSDYQAYLDTGRFKILSASPELFFKWDGKELTTRPMKGTARRGRWLEEDEENYSWLKNSSKNKTENKMVVELLQDELCTVAKESTAPVSSLFNIEKYPTVWQMTSTIKTKTKEDASLEEILTALFPSGSVTGVSKSSAMDLIAKLEDSPRGVYCGAIGYICPGGEAVFNVPIRTVIIDSTKGIAEYSAGGGITANSQEKEEYDEVFAKAAILSVKSVPFQLLETFRLQNGQYSLYEHHLKRLQASAKYFNYPIYIKKISEALQQFNVKRSNFIGKVRLLVNKHGDVTVEGQPITERVNQKKRVVIADRPIDRTNVFFYHKTTNRSIYEAYSDLINDQIDDVLLWNNRKEVTEFINGNIVVETNGKKYTPPISCGLLPGTFRAQLLKNGEIEERIIYLNELPQFSKVWLINSVRGWVSVNLYLSNS